ncbi:hypothetical protein P7K49_037757 [Saguinus oedipus]|uniref:Uncharacterized protein n=1 Tax=Saguinus oedipus TaxID=9490 RepID=A0ABQ9TIX9_SAGOE|nr:hypothetical protein P7K49_037757 [Saguinus oedipus]
MKKLGLENRKESRLSGVEKGLGSPNSESKKVLWHKTCTGSSPQLPVHTICIRELGEESADSLD